VTILEVEIKKKQKHKKVNFYHLSTGPRGKIENLINKFQQTFDLFETGNASKVETVELGQEQYYISAIQRINPDNADNYYVWAFDVCRLDTSREVIIGDLTVDVENRNKPLDTKDNEGLVVENQYIYDPFRSIIACTRVSGGVSTLFLKRFLNKFASVRGLRFELIPDEKALKDIDNITEMSHITYRIAAPNNFTELTDDNRDEMGDIEYAKYMGGDSFTLTLTATSLNLKRAKNKLKFLFKNSEELDVKKLEIEQDGFEPIDLIDHKMTYSGNVEYDHIITKRNMFDFLSQAYSIKLPSIRKMYKLPSES
jgi:hypothetical protein